MTNIKIIYLKIVVSLGICLQIGCAPKKSKSAEPAPSVPEEAYCSTVTAVANPVTLTGHADYQYLKPSYQSGAYGLTLNTENAPFEKPIRRAELRVKNSAGVVVQCGETDLNGDYSVQIEKPSAATSYSVEINSRGDNADVKASILDKATAKKYYTVSTGVAVVPTDSAVSVATITASATGNIEGGAFHILDEILEVNKYLGTYTIDASCSICQGFSVAPKVMVYWIKGFNPASYLGESSGLSFFDSSGSIDPIPSLYILGGSNGDVDTADTDHFDDSVIIHEYGHFLEKTYWKTDSPGGVHNGNLIIDPRLAFSEGFANFLPSAVTGSAKYIDTIGSPYGTPLVGVYLDLENEVGNGIRDKIITMSPVGEGVYREVSVARVLNDYLDDTATEKTFSSSGNQDDVAETSKLSFAFLWLALTNTSFGLKAPNQHFVSIGHFNKALSDAITAASTGDVSIQLSDLATARDGEFQTNGTAEYAQLVEKTSGSCVRTMTPVKNRPISGTSSYEADYYHDLFASSDFFRIDHPGGILNVELSYTETSNPPDLDLYIYKEVHSVGDSNDLVAASDKCRTATGSCAGESPSAGNESISVNLAAGTYMILVNAATTSQVSGGSTPYTLTSGGQPLCNAQ